MDVRIEDKVQESVRGFFENTKCSEAEFIVVVPPFASPDWPSLGAHIVAGIARECGVKASVLYANLSFAEMIGPNFYRALCVTKTNELVGERVFAAAYDKTRSGEQNAPANWDTLENHSGHSFLEIQRLASCWLAALSECLSKAQSRIIGFSSTFEQTISSLGMIQRIKQSSPEKLLVIGGANTDGPMGAALADFEPAIDHAFVGESEEAIRDFFKLLAGGERINRVLQGAPYKNMESLAKPDFRDFFTQFDLTICASRCPEGIPRSDIRIPYESSRGCWWGEKNHCTFCGLNASGMNHRLKSAEKVAEEVQSLADEFSINRVVMTDNIMPRPYFSKLIPLLRAQERKLEIFYEQKANISFDDMSGLAAGGITSIQPGIESLSTALLKRMKKGASAKVNIDCMRFARSLGIDIVWNVLVDFPGDEPTDYTVMSELMPNLFHLAPPLGLSPISIDRFSPYHDYPEEYEIANLRPTKVYSQLFRGGAIHDIAYHFEGDYVSSARGDPNLVAQLETVVENWRNMWEEDKAPVFCLFLLGEDRFLLLDTRVCAETKAEVLDKETAQLLWHGTNQCNKQTAALVDRQWLAEVDGRFQALATVGARECYDRITA